MSTKQLGPRVMIENGDGGQKGSGCVQVETSRAASEAIKVMTSVNTVFPMVVVEGVVGALGLRVLAIGATSKVMIIGLTPTKIVLPWVRVKVDSMMLADKSSHQGSSELEAGDATRAWGSPSELSWIREVLEDNA